MLTREIESNRATVTDAEIEAAEWRGLESSVGTAHAVAARFDEAEGALELILRGGLRLSIPVVLLQGVAGAAPELIARVELMGRGSALHWEELDADFSVQDLVAGSFGTRAWMQQLEEQGLLDDASLERRRTVDKLLDHHNTRSNGVHSPQTVAP